MSLLLVSGAVPWEVLGWEYVLPCLFAEDQIHLSIAGGWAYRGLLWHQENTYFWHALLDYIITFEQQQYEDYWFEPWLAHYDYYRPFISDSDSD